MSRIPDRQLDQKLSDLLRAEAPPARDAIFRLGVLERRERERFRLRSGLLLLVALAIAIAAMVGVKSGAEAAQTTLGLIALAALATVYGFHRAAVRRLLQRIGF